MGGRYYSISPDEYVFAALNIYLDIINLVSEGCRLTPADMLSAAGTALLSPVWDLHAATHHRHAASEG
jgi:hypothetical protein